MRYRVRITYFCTTAVQNSYTSPEPLGIISAMVEEKSRVERQRLAWFVLLGSFSICAVITIAIPFVANGLLQNLTESLNIFVQANQGVVGLDDTTGDRTALLAGEAGTFIESGERVLTGDTATALIAVNPPNEEQLLARLQVYSNTDITLLEAATPRFAVSDQEHSLRLKLDSGRLRLTVPQFGERPSQIIITTPQSDITIQSSGQYAIIVNTEETQVTVQMGNLTVTAVDETASLNLIENQRGVVPTGSGPVGPLETERNLIANGDFSQELNRWIIFPWYVDRAGQPTGLVRVLDAGNEPRLNINRKGVGQADVQVRQSVNQDVADVGSLRLEVTFRIISQSLEVCGILGSECPLFLRVNYVDGGGLSNTWQHGFYAFGEPSEDRPDICTTCAMVQDTHERVLMEQEYFYQVDLREEIARQGRILPQFIESVTLVFSGHSFEVEVVDVTLLAAD
ncbi:hypothetical protein MNBD_CHLOROFLEXI01-5247 [hydrothermal vent metagenome]|uniref:FecR protein domain-containing protein n=1 Tax=hydrothermal vent metagenome TaxID=652676 RepID=A0A3B0VHV1_9ZZZZ